MQKIISDIKLGVSICNKILDLYYNYIDTLELDKENKIKIEKDFYLTTAKNLTKVFEQIRKKIQNKEKLSDEEFSTFCQAAAYISGDMERRGKQYLKSSKELKTYIENLIKE